MEQKKERILNCKTKNETESQRCEYIDALRIAATLMVVLIHTITGVTDTRDMSAYPMENTVFLVLMDWSTWCVPVFVMISGYLFLQPGKQLEIGKLYRKNCVRILLALFVFGVPFAWMELFLVNRRFSLDMIYKGFWMVCVGKSWSHLWYLYLILFLYIITPFVRLILSKIPVWSVYVIACLLFVGCSLIPFLCRLGMVDITEWPDRGIYLFYYIVGYLFCTASTTRLAGRRYIPPVLIGLILIVTLASRVFGDYSVRMAYNYPFTVLLAILIMVWARENEAFWKKKNTATLKMIGTLCFAVYLIHPLFLNLLYKFFDVTPLQLPITFSLPIFWSSVTIASFMAAYLLRKIPLLQKWVL